MVRNLLFVVSCAVAVSVGTSAEPGAPKAITPESLTWFSPPNNPLLRAAWVLGGEKESGTYALRVIMAKGARIPPHKHPDTRYSTVLSGTLHVGFGETMQESRMVSVPAGAVYVAPANVPHYLWSKDGDVTYQEGGVGPTATVPVER